ncbi:KAP family P-loop NTPase fold protein [Schaalia turicensis]|uniref:KAP family P-loop NTPase fold protein n=1 Tax=Schaalia turicensis TaxID=131111 RepID=UPI00189946AF|nr:P-loop NTPase fold protein [Schaalia turicensis]
MNDNSCIGFDDEPTTEDLINAKPYIQGFVSFITQCPTPMTTAIQGDWGSGKTSSLIAIKNEDKLKDAWVLEFNTWQYSQFNLGEQLVFSLIGEILTQLKTKIEQSSNEGLQSEKEPLKEKLTRVACTLSPLAKFGATVLGFRDAYEALEQTYSKHLAESHSEDNLGPNQLIKSISTLRSDLQDLVDAITRNGPDRIYIFIDDLDRLEPERAVEVMEALKVFLNLRGCVFVLAIDFAVVLRGVRSKYGADFSEDKARSFFDKIIQIPFNLPVSAYEIEGILESGLNSLGVAFTRENLPQYVDLVNHSIGTNPRSIKRILNTFALILEISKVRTEDTPEELSRSQLDVFAVLCLQTGYQKLFRELLRYMGSGNSAADFLKQSLDMTRSDDDETDRFSEALKRWGLEPVQGPVLARFLGILEELFSDGRWNNLNNQRIMDALANAAITAVGLGHESDTVISDGRISKLEDIDSRLAALPNEKVSIATKNNLRAFEDELTRELGAVVAGDTGKYWGYAIGEGGETNARIGGNRFAELHYGVKSFRVEFGNFLSKEKQHDLWEEAKRAGLETRAPSTAKPPMSMKSIASEEAARAAARIVVKAYRLGGQ